MNNFYIANEENVDLFNDKEILSLDKSAQTQVSTQTEQTSPPVNYLSQNNIIIGSFAAILFVIVFVIIILKSKKKNLGIVSQPNQTINTSNSNNVVIEKKRTKNKS